LRAEVSEIGPVPKIVNPQRKARARNDLRFFLITYFPHSTGFTPFSTDHERIIADEQRSIMRGERQVRAVYREFGKTTISENSTLWGALYGYRQFTLFTGLNKSASTANIEAIKSELAENDLLAEDFPEVCYPIRRLEGKPQLTLNQKCRGQRTKILWRSDTVRLPEIRRSRASGVIIMAKPFLRARGVKAKRADGANVRPDRIVVDDIEDSESAANPSQVRKNLMTVKKVLVHSARHDRPLSITVNGTMICRGSMLDQLLADPAWNGQRLKFLLHEADAKNSFWLGDYARVRRAFDRSIPGDKERAGREATALYLSRREEADAGCQVAWIHRYSPPAEVSAIQHVYNVLVDDGPEVLASEYQNDPLDERIARSVLTAALVASKTNGLARGAVPKWAEFIGAYIDVHKRLLYYVVSAWSNPFQGAVIDYGTFPPQPVPYYTEARAPVGMDDTAGRQGGLTEEAWILAGLRELATGLLQSSYRREDGATLAIGQLLVDARWGQHNELVKSFCRRSVHGGRLMAAQGYGSGTRKPPLRTLPLKPGTRDGNVWRILPATAGDRWVTIDANAAKSLLARRLAMPLGTPGGIELWGVHPGEHALFADHCVSETPQEISAGGLTYEVWDWPLPHADNHYWDCLVGSMVAGMMLGARVAEWGAIRPKRKLQIHFGDRR